MSDIVQNINLLWNLNKHVEILVNPNHQSHIIYLVIYL